MPNPLPTLSLQPSTLQNLFDLDTQADAVLDRLKQCDIAAIEGGGKDAAAYGEKLRARGLKYSGTHIALSVQPDPKALIADLKGYGGADIINSGILEWNNPGVSDFEKGIKALNDLGRILTDAGVKLHYHNHALEFAKLSNGATGMKMLLDGLDPDVCGLCIDVAWVFRGGDDPADFLQTHASRITYLHLKDTTADQWRPLGAGNLLWPGIVAAIKTLRNVRFAAIEQDKVDGDPWIAIAQSRQFLKDKFGW